MTATSVERLRKARSGDHLNRPVKANAQILRGAIVMAVGLHAVNAAAAASRAELETIQVLGLAVDSVLGGGADGDVRAQIERAGAYCLANSAGADEITAADIGELCFVADNQTLAKTVGAGLRPIAGLVVDVDSDGVWVDFRFARGPRRHYLAFAINQTDTLAGTSQELISPVVGAITQLDVTVQTTVTTGGNVTASVDGVAVDGLACVVANAATKGTRVTDTPTAGHATTIVAVGSRIQAIPAAAFDTAGAVSGLVEITY